MNVLLSSFVILVILGVPLAYSMGMTAFVTSFIVAGEQSFMAIPLQLFASVDQVVFLAIPLFMLSGELMVVTGIMERLLTFCMMLVGRFRGSLALVAVLCSMVFAGISGSAVADAAAVGAILIPAMKKHYDHSFGSGVVAAASVIGPILPPSIPMIVYAMATGNVSIGALFIAGVIPGLLIGLGMMGVILYIAHKNKYPITETHYSRKEIIRLTWQVIPTLIMPVIIVGGIRFGVVTPTEAAGVAVLYALILGAFMRTITVRAVWDCMVRSAKVASMVFMVIGAASVLALLMTQLQLDKEVAAWFKDNVSSPYTFLILLNVFLLIIGCFMECSSATILLMPIIAPIAYSYGIHPVHLGLVVVLNLCIGLITPPVGTCLFVVCGIARMPILQVARGMLPFFLWELVVLLGVTFIPELSLWLPRLLGSI